MPAGNRLSADRSWLPQKRNLACSSPVARMPCIALLHHIKTRSTHFATTM